MGSLSVVSSSDLQRQFDEPEAGRVVGPSAVHALIAMLIGWAAVPSPCAADCSAAPEGRSSGGAFPRCLMDSRLPRPFGALL